MTNALAPGIVSVRTRVISRYVKFVSTLLKSDSPEVVAVANSAVNDRGSVTGANLFKIQQETGLNPRSTSPQEVMSVLNVTEQDMPSTEKWRIPFLRKLLETRRKMKLSLEETKQIDWLIDSLCSS